MNEYDSAKMLDVLRDSVQMEPTDDPKQADLLLLNTAQSVKRPRKRFFRSSADGVN